MTHEGCFGRGAVLVLINDDASDVAVGYGKDVKRDPGMAARHCAKLLSLGLKNSKRPKTLVFEFVSGPTVPKFPFLTQKRIIRNRLIGKLFALGAGLFLRYFQKGVGREEELLEELEKQLPNSTIIGGSTLDANNLISNYQFLNRQVFTNSVVALALKTDHMFHTGSGFCQSETPVKFRITEKIGNGRIITKLDGKPAAQEFLKRSGWSDSDLNERLYRKTFHRTLGFKHNGRLYPEVIGAIYGEGIWLGYRVEGDELVLLTTSGRRLVESVNNTLSAFSGLENNFGFIISCASRMETLGKSVYLSQRNISLFFKDKPFLLLWMGGEDIASEQMPRHHANYCFNALVFN